MKTIYFDKDIPRVVATKGIVSVGKKVKAANNLLYGGLNAVKYAKNIPEPALPAEN
ncbi:MAG: hypothetical protein Q4F54_04495 [Coriobacteriia bacterium]|nr:hypothetical protein [Coriobacteriia bacterium]